MGFPDGEQHRPGELRLYLARPSDSACNRNGMRSLRRAWRRIVSFENLLHDHERAPRGKRRRVQRLRLRELWPFEAAASTMERPHPPPALARRGAPVEPAGRVP